MTCPHCHARMTVSNTRPDQQLVRRYRTCRQCHHRFPTIEIPEVEYQTAVRALRREQT